jgi:broad specificity phosphatase PhoE
MPTFAGLAVPSGDALESASGSLDAARPPFVAECIVLIFSAMKRYAIPRLALAVSLVVFVPTAASAQKAVLVVRHAEKTADQQVLTEAGRARAQRLAAMLKDSGIAAIYSTDTRRTRDTVEPLAGALKLKVELYDTGASMSGEVDARPFVAKLEKDHPKDVVLVVGHSNTIPNLLAALGCAEKVVLADGEYDNLFVVVPKADGVATLLRLRYWQPPSP